MKHLKIFIDLTRINKPIGFMLLFWPCSWGLAYGYNFNQDLKIFLIYLLLFFLGAVLMRSAGCIFNDIVDRDLDKKVHRTRKRPIASKKISLKKSFLYIASLCSLALLILIQFNFLTIILGIGSMLLAFSYPFMKRLTYWPQLFLGLTFNWGIIMAWTAMNNIIVFDIIILYMSAIFWTLGYDTIYGVQDIKDDEIIGVKSTAIKFKKNIKLFVSISYLLTCFILTFIFYNKIGLNIFTMTFIFFIISLIYQIVIFDKSKPESCLTAFKFNNISGLILFLSIFLINF
jgi:4-hydroxybenzoate polyprenyltransferase